MARAHARRRRQAEPTSGNEALIARAEAAMVRLSSHFAGWMDDECRRLEAACRRAAADRSDMAALDHLHGVAHDVKGEAATFGFLPVERIAASLCRLITGAPDRSRIPADLIAGHVTAARHALQLYRKGDVLAAEIEQAANVFLDAAAKTCPVVQSPPLAPEE